MCYEHKAVDVQRRGRLPAAKDGGEGQREEALLEKGAQTSVSLGRGSEANVSLEEGTRWAKAHMSGKNFQWES